MSNHTKGPWAVQKADDCMGRQLDDMVKWVITAEDGDIWISTGPTWDPEHSNESEANAHLISSAPELLQALELALSAIVFTCNEMTVGDRFTNAGQTLLDAITPCRKAILKAIGESA